jgi:hypothetical protein
LRNLNYNAKRRKILQDSTIELIQKLLINFEKEYLSFSKCFYNKQNELFNLRKLQILEPFESQLLINKLIGEYKNKLEQSNLLNDQYFLTLEENHRFRKRIKSDSSIRRKINHNLRNHRYFSKTLNDIFGARIILTDIECHKNEIWKLLSELKQSGILYRFYFRIDGNYRGIHCYIQDCNKHFPWELQIWDSSWSELNYLEHTNHENNMFDRGGS